MKNEKQKEKVVDDEMRKGKSEANIDKKKDNDAILPTKGLVTRAMNKRLQEDWARAAEEGPRVLMNLRVDF